MFLSIDFIIICTALDNHHCIAPDICTAPNIVPSPTLFHD